jgi:glucose/arabinose dehydrogenase
MCVLILFTGLSGCKRDGSKGTVAGSPSSPIALARAFPGLKFKEPVLLIQAPGDTTRMFVVEQGGTVHAFPNSDAASAVTTFVDIGARVESGGEAGLLGMAFHPDFTSNGLVFLSYTRAGPDSNTPLVSVIARYLSRDNGATLDPASETVLLELDQPFTNHNGGHIVFGPDGFLYIGFGDGGNRGDPNDNGQNTNTLLGKLLRIDVTGGTAPYGIPADNPFVAGGGAPEIYAFGLRNPWRFSFDRATGDLWLGDVGQNRWEEVDRITRGGNYGWDEREGAHCFEPASGCRSAGLIDPIVEYEHTGGRCSITGGHVYRGSSVPAMRGMYLYGDFCTGEIWNVPASGGGATLLHGGGINISSFGEDHAGELYVLSYSEGAVYRIVAQ